MSIERTTTLGSSTSMLNYIKSGESNYYKLAEEASSGLKLTTPSDNPTGARTVMNINTKLSQLTSYSDNMSLAQNELDVLDNTFTSINDSIQSASDLATQASNGTYSSTDLNNIKTQINQIMANVTDLANTQYNGNYIFSGTSTSTPAYKIVTDASGSITSATYQGTPSTGDYQRSVQISDGVSIPINTTGDQVFGSYSNTSATAAAVAGDVDGTTTTTTNGITTSVTIKLDGAGNKTTTTQTGSGLLYTLGTLSTALGKADTTAVASSLDSLSNNSDTILASQTQFASVSQRFVITQSANDTMTTQLKSSRSDLQDADLSQVLTDLTAQQTALQATMSVTSTLLNGVTLLDYIK